MRWPRDGAPAPGPGDALMSRIAALPPAEVPARVAALVPWWRKAVVWMSYQVPRRKPRRRGMRL